MTHIIKETITTNGNLDQLNNSDTQKNASNYQTIEYVLFFILAIIEIALSFRLVLRVLGANSSSIFVNVIYKITTSLMFPFEGIFRRGVTQGLETVSVFEPSTIVAMIVYAVLLYGIVSLIHIFSGKEQSK